MAIAQILMSIIQTNKGTNRKLAFKILCDIKFTFLCQSMCKLSHIQKIGDSSPSKDKEKKRQQQNLNDTLMHKTLAMIILATYSMLVT